jgi:site-specific DNA recombinase
MTGLIHCARCGGAMTIRTGKGGRYPYCARSSKARQEPTACPGMAVAMVKLDDLMVRDLEEWLLQPERLKAIVAAILERRRDRSERQRAHAAELAKRASWAGVADLNDPALKDSIGGLKAIRGQARTQDHRAQAMLDHAGQTAVTPQMLSRVAQTARDRMRLPGGGFRRDHLRGLAQRVEMAEGEVRIIGSRC